MARKILVVEDDRNISDLIRMYLEREGFEVHAAFDGGAAVEQFRALEPDMVLLDYEMPVCNGSQTLMMLRSEESFADIPVFFLTGRDDPDIVTQLLALKPAGYLLKYLKPAEIKKKIDDYFEKKV